jgi:hypothetical protein
MAEEQFERRTAFNAGEISPWLDPRIDQDKYHLGCRQMLNCRPTVYGGVFKRPGFELLGTAASPLGLGDLNASKLVAFQNFILEFTDLSMRVWTTGASPELVNDPDTQAPLQVTTPWRMWQLGGLQHSPINDRMYFTHADVRPYELARYEDNDWRLVSYNPDWPALMPINVLNTTLRVVTDARIASPWSPVTTYQTGDVVTREDRDFACRHNKCKKIDPGNHKDWRRWWRRKHPTDELGIGRSVTLVASKPTFNDPGHVGTKWVMVWRRESLIKTLHLNGGDLGKTTTSIYCLGTWSAGTLADNSGTGNWEVEVSLQRSFDNFTWENYRVITNSKGDVQNLLTGDEKSPCFLRLKLTTRSGTIPTQYKAELEVAHPDQHAILRVVQVYDQTSARSVIEFPVPNGSETELWYEPAWSSYRGFPRAIALHDMRLWFGGTRDQPTTFWATALDRFETFRIGANPDMGKEFRVLSDEPSSIQWMVSHEGLIIGTTSAEWLFGERLGEDLPKLRKNTSHGSAPIQARAVNDAVVFIQKSRRSLRELSSDGAKLKSVDLTLLAEHFGDAEFVQMAIQRQPETIVWVVTTRGDLLGMVYERSQNVNGWFRYVTDGKIESVALVETEYGEDELWVSVVRDGYGATNTKRYIERLQPEVTRKLKVGGQDAIIFSDSAKIYQGPGTLTMTGLEHLNGKKVLILADGAPAPSQIFYDGKITLQYPAQTIVVGRAYEARLEPTYLETSDPGSITKAFKKRITKSYVEFWKTLNCDISGNGGTTWDPIEFRNVADRMDQAPPLWSGIKELSVPSGSERQASITLRSVQPLPMNILSLTMRFVMGTA